MKRITCLRLLALFLCMQSCSTHFYQESELLANIAITADDAVDLQTHLYINDQLIDRKLIFLADDLCPGVYQVEIRRNGNRLKVFKWTEDRKWTIIGRLNFWSDDSLQIRVVDHLAEVDHLSYLKHGKYFVIENDSHKYFVNESAYPIPFD